MIEFVIGALIVLSILALCSLPMFQNEADYHLAQQRKQKKSTGPPVTEGTPWPTPSWEEDYLRQRDIELQIIEKEKIRRRHAAMAGVAEENPNDVRKIEIRWVK